MRALVLGGGDLKGAWQAGRLRTMAENGWKDPDLIVGTSIGAVNGAFLADQLAKGHSIDEATTKLLTLWQSLRGPSDVNRKRRWYELAFDLLRGQWNGLLDLGPLDTLLHEHIGTKPERAIVVTCNYVVGATESKKNPTADRVLASASVPIIANDVNGRYDGGVQRIVPLKDAIDAGAVQIDALVTQAAVEPTGLTDWSLLGQVRYTFELMAAQQVEDAIRMTDLITKLVRLGHPPQPHHKAIDLVVHRPNIAYPYTMENFTPAQVREMIEDGRDWR